MELTLEELREIYYWGFITSIEFGLDEDDEILLDKIFKELEEKRSFINE